MCVKEVLYRDDECRNVINNIYNDTNIFKKNDKFKLTLSYHNTYLNSITNNSHIHTTRTISTCLQVLDNNTYILSYINNNNNQKRHYNKNDRVGDLSCSSIL